MPQPKLHSVADAINASENDSLVVVCPPTFASDYSANFPFAEALSNHAAIDKSVFSEPTLVFCANAPGGRLVTAPTGPISRDYDDVRRYSEAAAKGVARAVAAGSSKPLVQVVSAAKGAQYEKCMEASVLGILQHLYAPLQGREALGDNVTEPVVQIGVLGASDESLKVLEAIEAGRRLARDVGAADAERMNPGACADYIAEAFRGSSVTVTIIDDPAVIEREYPLMYIVARGCLEVPRHRPRVVRLEYKPDGEPEEALYFASKGVVYDTGGHDLKVGGIMAGMSRDKCGAATTAGFLKVVDMLRPKNVAVSADLGFVRNGIGPNAFVSDDIVKSRAGVRVRIGNTDAEGRLVMADILCHQKERAIADNPQKARLFTMATLTGHAIRAYGVYSIALDNGPAGKANISKRLQEAGHLLADPFEISYLRREDYDFVKPVTIDEDVVHTNTEPSSATARGHMCPMAFMAIASGLDKCGNDSDQPVAFTHLDIAASSEEGFLKKATGSTIAALTAAFLLKK